VAVVTPKMEPRAVFELKIDDVEWTLWDIFKMVSAAQLPTVEVELREVALARRAGLAPRENFCERTVSKRAEERVAGQPRARGGWTRDPGEKAGSLPGRSERLGIARLQFA
jgi:hypothetical protein